MPSFINLCLNTPTIGTVSESLCLLFLQACLESRSPWDGCCAGLRVSRRQKSHTSWLGTKFCTLGMCSHLQISYWYYIPRPLHPTCSLVVSQVHLGRCIAFLQRTQGRLNKQREDGSILNKIYRPRMNVLPCITDLVPGNFLGTGD